jgi:hypothetical protein
MSSTDPIPEKEKRIDDILKMIGGLEVSIRIALEKGDKEFVRTLQPLEQKYYEKLRRVVYGLPEKSGLPTEEES